jgi:hypothetical protein
MGRQADQGALFYEFRLEDRMPERSPIAIPLSSSGHGISKMEAGDFRGRLRTL